MSSRLSAQDLEALQAHHEFIRSDDKDRQQLNTKWEMRMARKFYNKLFKEFALVDLSRYQEGRLGMRWRTEAEVASGRGHQSCGGLLCPLSSATNATCNPTPSSSSSSLHSYEVPFRYKESGEVKLELVKVRLCPECAEKLFHHKVKEMQQRAGAQAGAGGAGSTQQTVTAAAASAGEQGEDGDGGMESKKKKKRRTSSSNRDADGDTDTHTHIDTHTHTHILTDSGTRDGSTRGSGDVSSSSSSSNSGKKRKVELPYRTDT